MHILGYHIPLNRKHMSYHMIFNRILNSMNMIFLGNISNKDVISCLYLVYKMDIYPL